MTWRDAGKLLRARNACPSCGFNEREIAGLRRMLEQLRDEADERYRENRALRVELGTLKRAIAHMESSKPGRVGSAPHDF